MNMNESLEESEIVRERREGKSGDKGPQGECFHAISTSPKLPRSVYTPWTHAYMLINQIHGSGTQ